MKYIPEFHFELKFHHMYLAQNFHLKTKKLTFIFKHL